MGCASSSRDATVESPSLPPHAVNNPNTFIGNIEWRRAYKRFGASSGPEDVPAGVEHVLRAVAQAPSSFGSQPYKVIVVTNQELKAKLQPAAYGQAQIAESTHLLVFCSMTNVAERGDEFIKALGLPDDHMYVGMIKGAHGAPGAAEWAAKQAYIALSFGLAAAAEMKINSCPMEGFDKDQFAQLLELPATLKPQCLLALGKPFEDDATARGFPRFRFSDVVIEKK